MAKDAEYTTLRVVKSQALLRPDGRGAIALYFDRGDPIAIEMSPHIVGVLQRQLATLAGHFARKSGEA